MLCRHEIEESTCGVCRPRPGTAVPGWPRVTGGWVPARYPGRCGACEDRIFPGDQIRSNGEGGWLCADCGGEAAL